MERGRRMNNIEKAIENINDFIEVWELEQADEYMEMIISKEDIDAFKIAISALEKQLNNGWIPVSERLPESIGDTVLITVPINRGTSHHFGSLDIAYMRNDEKRVFYGTDGEYSFDEVTAWQPLPEPYKQLATDNNVVTLSPEEVQELKAERDYWEREAKKWCAKLGGIRLLIGEQN